MDFKEEGFVEGQKNILNQLSLCKDKIDDDENYYAYVSEWIVGARLSLSRAEKRLKESFE